MTPRYMDLVSQAYDSIKNDLALAAGLSLVYLLGLWSVSLIPFGGGLLTCPLTAGYMFCLLKIRAKQDIGYGDFFWGFTSFNRLGQLLIANVLVTFLSVLGMILFLIPGIWFIFAASFVTSFIVLEDTDGITAIKKSLAASKNNWWWTVGLILFIALIAMAGTLCFLVGLLFALPVANLMLLIATEKLTPHAEAQMSLKSAGATAAASASVNPSVMQVNPTE